MKFATSASAIALISASSIASAQLLQQGTGTLPSCGQSCAILTQAQSTCGSNWACFCKNVWSSSGGALTTVCASSCTDPTDNTAIEQWYTNNCGSDNGASEHGSSSGGGSNGNSGGSSAASSSAAAAGPSTTGNAGVSASDANSQPCSSWFNCHWKWVVMIIVLALGLTILGVGGRWLKKRHDRKQDRINGGFNTGITERNQEMSGPNNGPSSSFVGGEQPAGGRDSPMRTREAFMPYGYGYTRSESRLASQGHEKGSPLARGTTPVGELERNAPDDSASRKKSRRVLVRERSGDDES